MEDRYSEGTLIDGIIWSSESLTGDLETLIDDYGPRWSGTPEESQAAGWLARRLEEIGLERVGLESFEYNGWRDDETGLTVMIEGQPPETIPVISHIFSPPTPPGGLEAPLVYVGAGRRRQFEAVEDRIKGSFVLCETTPWPIFFKGFEAAASPIKSSIDYGAAGFVLMGYTPGAGPRVGCCSRGKMGAIPCVGIGKEEGEFLKRTLDRGRVVTLGLDSRTGIETRNGSNVVGEIGPDGRDLILLTAHYDGHRIGRGAQDNASGVVSLLEAARVLASMRENLHSTIRVVFFAAEELGLLGSEAYVVRHQEELERIKFMLNVDIAWPPFGLVVQASPELAGAVREWNRRSGMNLNIQEKLDMGSDHEPFVKKGVPAIVYEGAAGPGEFPNPHTGVDTFEKVDIDGVKKAASTIGRVVADLASREKVPAGRLPSGDLDRFLKGGS